MDKAEVHGTTALGYLMCMLVCKYFFKKNTRKVLIHIKKKHQLVVQKKNNLTQDGIKKIKLRRRVL